MPASTKTVTVPDLTQRPPRSLRSRLGGFAVLPRLLDKCRATVAGKAGEYHYNCPLDRQLLSFVGVEAEALKAEVAAGKTDSELLGWIHTHAQQPRTAWEIEAWSAYQDKRRPESDPGTTDYFAKTLAGITQARTDIQTWADLLDLDDHVSFGGAA